MAAELNELFEEAVTRCGELTDAADEAMNAIGDTGEQARELAARVQEEGNEARQHLREMAAGLEKADDAIGAGRREADGSLEELTGRAVELKDNVGALLERVNKAAAQLEEQRGRLDDSIDAQMTTAQGDFGELAQMALGLEAEASQRLEQASESIAAFRSAIDAARAVMVQKQVACATALDRLEASAHEQANVWLAGLHGLLGRQAAAMVNAANVMVDWHNDTMDIIKGEFAEEAPQQLGAAMEPLQASLRNLGEEAAARQQALSAHTEELRAAMGGQISVLGDLRALVEATAELG